MTPIPPITDSYIDDIIKSVGAYDSGLNKTQGVKLRELIKLLRDRFEQGAAIDSATETNPGIIELATIAEALARTDDERAMTALKTISLILDEKKNVSYQIAPVSLNEVSILMENAGQVNSALIAGANNLKLKIGISGAYPSGVQVYPFAYAAGDRVFMTYNYDDLNNASCNIKLKCKDN